MVYSGRPSTGCHTCRARRIKCDETKPTCNQCAKGKRQCGGYYSRFELLHRDETQATQQRAEKAMARAHKSRDSTPSDAKTKNVSTVKSQKKPSAAAAAKPKTPSKLPPSPSTSLREQAICHFTSNYVLLPTGTERGYLEFIAPIARANPPRCFQLALEACAWASLGCRVGSGNDIVDEALQKYTKALPCVAEVINDPVQSTNDSTVAAVLLLALYENITSTRASMLAWGSHTEGAIELIKKRGPDQHRTKVGRDVFLSVRTQQMIHSFTSGQAPSVGSEFWFQGPSTDPVGGAVQQITMRVSELRTEMNRLLTTTHRSTNTADLLAQLIQKCQTYDSDYLQWANNLPKYFQCQQVAWTDDYEGFDCSVAEAYPGRLDIFRDLRVASLWSTCRCARIVLASLIIRATAWMCAPYDYHYTFEYERYSNISKTMIEDLIASIPYQLGYFSKQSGGNLAAYACGQDNAPKGLAGYFVLWPLSCIVAQDFSSENQRAWAKGRLNYIGGELGVRNANMILNINIRVPSMLIDNDRASADTLSNNSVDFQEIVSTKLIPPSGITKDQTILDEIETYDKMQL